jgi:hypothetical protein
MSNILILRNKIQITDIKHKSSSKALKGVKVGDILLLEIEVKDVTFGSRAGVYASAIEVTNLRTGYKNNTTMTLFANAFKGNYKYIEVE